VAVWRCKWDFCMNALPQNWQTKSFFPWNEKQKCSVHGIVTLMCEIAGSSPHPRRSKYLCVSYVLLCLLTSVVVPDPGNNHPDPGSNGSKMNLIRKIDKIWQFFNKNAQFKNIQKV
jgi:hypothetical protein